MTESKPRYFSRLRNGLTHWPGVRGWLESALLAAVFAALAYPSARAAGLIGSSWSLTGSELLPLALRVLLAPALLEEILFRLLPNPHPAEEAPTSSAWISGVGSVAAYVLVHPLAALLARLESRAFFDPIFLLLVALLGSVCLLAYRRTGSLWPAVALHWLVVMCWLGFGGSGPLSGAG